MTTGVFIDGTNLFMSTKAIDLNIDYSRLKEYLTERFGDVLRLYYYTAVRNDAAYSSVRKLIDWLDYHGYTIITKPTKTFTDDETGEQRIKGNMDVEITVDMMRMLPHIDHYVLFSGDGDFRYLVNQLQDQGRRVTAISARKTHPPMIADELRRQVDEYIDLSDIAKDICKISDRHPFEFSSHEKVT